MKRGKRVIRERKDHDMFLKGQRSRCISTCTLYSTFGVSPDRGLTR